jgi:hypothetical protein
MSVTFQVFASRQIELDFGGPSRPANGMMVGSDAAIWF